jgi:gas vesicle protein
MQNPERLIVLIKTVCEENFYKTYYDLFLTDKRMVLIHKKSKLDANYGSLIGGVAGGIAGAILGTIMQNATDSSKKKREIESAQALDELLKVDKKNFAVPYDGLEWFKLNRSRSEYCSLVFKIGKKTRTFYLMDERAEQLANTLPDIVALNDKLVK